MLIGKNTDALIHNTGYLENKQKKWHTVRFNLRGWPVSESDLVHDSWVQRAKVETGLVLNWI